MLWEYKSIVYHKRSTQNTETLEGMYLSKTYTYMNIPHIKIEMRGALAIWVVTATWNYKT
jgi:hypothetical protein